MLRSRIPAAASGSISPSARSYFPWSVQFDEIAFKPMGEYSSVLEDLSAAPMPMRLAFLEKKAIAVSFTVDDALFYREYASEYVKDADETLEACLERFINDVGFIFYSDDIPTHEALCLNWE